MDRKIIFSVALKANCGLITCMLNLECIIGKTNDLLGIRQKGDVESCHTKNLSNIHKT